jgi:hypothetical protein
MQTETKLVKICIQVIKYIFQMVNGEFIQLETKPAKLCTVEALNVIILSAANCDQIW